MGFQQTVLHRIQQKSRNLKNCWLMNCQKNYLRNCRSCLPRNCNQLYCQYQLHYHTHRIHNQKIHQKNHLQHFHLHHTEHLLRNYLRSELLPVLLQLLRPLPLPDVLPLLLLQYVLPQAAHFCLLLFQKVRILSRPAAVRMRSQFSQSALFARVTSN